MTKISTPLLTLLLSTILIFSSIQPIQAQQCPPDAEPRLLLVGDSWAQFMWLLRSYRGVFEKYGHADKEERGSVTAQGGTKAWEWTDPARLSQIKDELIDNPTIDIVMISLGGNDLLAGRSSNPPGWYDDMTATQEDSLFSWIRDNIQVVIDSIESYRPGTSVMVTSYDYPNFSQVIENNASSNYKSVWEDMGEPEIYDGNMSMVNMEEYKQELAVNNPNVRYIPSIGLMHYVYGFRNPSSSTPSTPFDPRTTPYPGTTPPNYTPSPGGDPNYPSALTAMAFFGTDAIHLGNGGYFNLADHHMKAWLHERLRGNPDATLASQGGTNDGWVAANGTVGTGECQIGYKDSAGYISTILSFDTSVLPDDVQLEGASLFISRFRLVGDNPLGQLGTPTIDIKNGTFGMAGVDGGDFTASADATDVGCTVGDAPDDDFTLRIDIEPAALTHVNPTGTTEIRFYLKGGTATTGDQFMRLFSGDTTGLLAPYLDLHFSTAASIDDELALGEVSVYPSPTNDLLNVVADFENRGQAQLSVKNLLGQALYTTPLTVSAARVEHTVDVSSLPSGVYLLDIEMEGRHMSQRFVVGK